MIDPATLAEDIETCLSLTSAQITPVMIQRSIDRLRQQGSEITNDTKPTHRLAELVSRNLTFLKDDTRQALLSSEVYVIPLPLCIAFAKSPHSIFIGNGLLNLITACGYWANFCESLPPSLDQIKPLKEFPTVSVSDAIHVYLFALMHRHHQYGEPLPDFRTLSVDRSGSHSDQFVRNAVSGAATFILLHELGHLQLNHISGEKPIRPIDVPLAVPQDLSNYQLKELEADDYAMMALEEKLRPLHSAWIDMALNFNLMQETLLGSRGQMHPININRLAYAHARIQGKKLTPIDYNEQIERMGHAHLNIEANNDKLREIEQKPLLDALTREEIMSKLELLDSFLQPVGFTIQTILDEQSELPDWTECLF